MVTVLVASTNPCKIEACQLAFCRVSNHLGGMNVRFSRMIQSIFVLYHPIVELVVNLLVTMKHAKVSLIWLFHLGAINRVHNVLSKWRCDNSADPDCVVGLEVCLMIDCNSREGL